MKREHFVAIGIFFFFSQETPTAIELENILERSVLLFPPFFSSNFALSEMNEFSQT